MEGRELPVGWSQAEIGDLCELQNGRAFKSSDWEEVGVPIVRIQNLNKANSSFNYYQGPVDERNRLKGGELLFAWSGTPGTSFGAHVWNGGEAVLNQHIFRVDFDETYIDKRFFRFAINQKLNELIDNAHGGVGLRHVTKGKFEKTQVAVPPFNEQRRIAAKLDTTLAAVEACRQRLDGVAAILKRFRQAVLAAATSGELTREWRGERGVERDWEQASIEQIAKVGTGSTPLRSNPAFYATSGIPWITSASTSEELITVATEFVTAAGQAASRLRVYPEGTLLVAMYGEGKTRGQVSELGIAAAINQACAAIHAPKECYLMPFIKIVLKANYLEMRSLAEGGNQPNLNLSKIKQFHIGLPSKSEVLEICDRVESLFTLACQLEAKLATARKVVDRLTPALLAKAFRGELVPQDPSDERASVLLERIRAARQAEAATGKPSRRGRRKAAAHPEQTPLPAAPAPPDLLAQLLQECGALSERALLAASELDPAGFRAQLALEQGMGAIRATSEDEQVLLEAVG